jgi:hypothetical protein
MSRFHFYKYIWEVRCEAVTKYSEFYNKHSEEWNKFKLKYESKATIDDEANYLSHLNRFKMDINNFKIHENFFFKKSILGKDFAGWLTKSNLFKPCLSDFFFKSILGKDFAGGLTKSNLFKPWDFVKSFPSSSKIDLDID